MIAERSGNLAYINQAEIDLFFTEVLYLVNLHGVTKCWVSLELR